MEGSLYFLRNCLAILLLACGALLIIKGFKDTAGDNSIPGLWEFVTYSASGIVLIGIGCLMAETRHRQERRRYRKELRRRNK